MIIAAISFEWVSSAKWPVSKKLTRALHIIVDDLPWWWADTSDSNTVDIANFPPGQHKVTIQLVDANHNVIAGQTKTLTFTIPKGASHSH